MEKRIIVPGLAVSPIPPFSYHRAIIVKILPMRAALLENMKGLGETQIHATSHQEQQL
jgi:hypothetical protein